MATVDFFEGFKEEDVRRVFNEVCNKEDWKLSIAAVIPKSQKEIVRVAIEFFTSSSVKFQPIRNKDGSVDKLFATAPGYYKTAGA